MKLPVIDLEKITTIEEAKNVIEQIMSLVLKQQEEIEFLKQEIARLKGQPKKPTFPIGSRKQSISVTSLLKEKGSWSKSSKKGKITIDRVEQMREVEKCSCGCSLQRPIVMIQYVHDCERS